MSMEFLVTPAVGDPDLVLPGVRVLHADAHGYARWVDLKEGDYSIRSYPDVRIDPDVDFGGRKAQGFVHVDANAVTRLELDLSTEGKVRHPGDCRIRGQIRRNGAPWPGAILNLSSRIDSTPEFDELLRTDSEGRFASFFVAPGNYDVFVELRRNGFDRLVETNVSLVAGEDAHVDLDVEMGGPLRGAVVLPADVGSTRRTVLIRSIGSAGVESPAGVFINTSCDGSGQFEYPELPAGKYSLRATAKGFLPKYGTIEVLRDEPTHEVNLVLSRGPIFRGRVEVPSEGAAARATLEFRPVEPTDEELLGVRSWERVLSTTVHLDEEARFETGELPPRTYEVRLSLRNPAADGEFPRFRPLTVELPSADKGDLVLRFQRK